MGKSSFLIVDRKSKTQLAIIGLLALSVLLAISVVPGVGIERYPLSFFPNWQVTMFMYGGPAMIILSLTAIGAVLKWTRIGAPLAIVAASLSFLFAILVIYGFGSPASLGVIDIDTIQVMVNLATMYLAVVIWRQPTTTQVDNI